MSNKIGWCDTTWNPVTGCTPISEACTNCYARRMAQRLKGRFGYPADDPFRVTLHPDKLDEPLKWKKPRRVFVVSMGDLFHEDVRFNFIAAVFGVMAACPQHTFLLLTKRPERVLEWFSWVQKRQEQGKSMFPNDDDEWRIRQMLCVEGRKHGANIPPHHGGEWPLPNVWLGVTAENQDRLEERTGILLQIPSAKRFVSLEPMLGPMELHQYIPHFEGCRCPECYHRAFKSQPAYTLDWVILGQETGPGARPAKAGWFMDVIEQCRAANVPVWVKKAPPRVPVIREMPCPNN